MSDIQTRLQNMRPLSLVKFFETYVLKSDSRGMLPGPSDQTLLYLREARSEIRSRLEEFEDVRRLRSGENGLYDEVQGTVDSCDGDRSSGGHGKSPE